jgi:hypothetical protein
MKKVLIIIASIITLLFVAAILIPVIFRDDIEKLVRKSIDDNIDAHVYYDPSKFDLTIIRSFPNPTASIRDFGIVGKGVFAGDTLFSTGNFGITIELFSLFGDEYRVKSIIMEKPRIQVKVLKSGAANYEIAKETEESIADSLETSSFKMNIAKWIINDGYFSYEDRTMDYEMILEGIDHEGSGDLTLDVYDLKTLTTVQKTMVNYEGVKYLNGQKVWADAIINIDMPAFRFTFKENKASINDFPFSFDGWYAMPAEDMDMDISFATEKASIKSLFSLIPGVYTEGYANIKAEGDLSCNGFVKGTYSETSMPAFNINLKAENGMIAYPDLPTPIKNIAIDMLVDCKDGNIDHTMVDIKTFHMDMGNNPIDGSLFLRNLTDYSMKAHLAAKLNLEELSTMFPMEGMTLKGLYTIDLKADGIYDSVRQIMPSISATMNLDNAYIKTSEFPKALENFSFASSIACPTGKMQDFSMNVSNFKLAMEGDEMSGRLSLQNLVDYEWDMALKGSLDLTVISAVYPIEGMTYAGKLLADIQTSGKYSDVEAGRYDKFPTSGTAALQNFTYSSPDLPQGMTIKNAAVSMTPKQLNIDSFNGTVGRSDMNITGFLTNYIDYVFQDNAPLTGKMTLSSKVLDVNEWMTGEVTAEEDTIPMEVVEIPRNIDFEFASSIEQIFYDNLVLKQAKGLLTVHDGVLDMSNLSFNLLGGAIVMNGKYDTRKPERPTFDYALNIKSLSIPQAFTSFSTVQTFAPFAQLMNGDFSTNFNISGALNKDMTPVYESLNANGLIEIANAFMKESKLVSGVAGYLKSDLGSKQLTLKNVIMKTRLTNGRAYVSPFDVSMGEQKAQIAGSIGADGSLDYTLNTEVDAGALGQQVNQLLASLQGQDAGAASSKVKLNFKIGGTYDSPKVMLAGTTNADGTTTTLQQEAKQQVNAQVDAVKTQAEQKAQEEADKLLDQAAEQAQPQIDTLSKKATEVLGEEADKYLSDSLKEDAKKTLQDLFKKKEKN